MKNNIVRNILFISSLVIVSQLIVSAQTPCTTLGIRMSIGSKDTIASHDVFNMQLFLQSRGYFSGEPTGYFGGLTKKAVQVFQKDNTIDQTGVVGTLLVQRLRH